MSYDSHQVYAHAMLLVRACNPVTRPALHRELVTQTVGINRTNCKRAADEFVEMALANGDIVIDDDGNIDLPENHDIRQAIGNELTARRITLVYQAGIANVFETTLPSQAKRLLQGTFDQCRYFALGCGAMGAIVRSAHCNEAGDITDREWRDDVENAVFNPVAVNCN